MKVITRYTFNVVQVFLERRSPPVYDIGRLVGTLVDICITTVTSLQINIKRSVTRFSPHNAIIINHHCQLHSSKEISVFIPLSKISARRIHHHTYNAYYKNPKVLKANRVCRNHGVYLRLL